MEKTIYISLPWLLLGISSILFIVLFLFVCVCWRTRKSKNFKYSYVMETGKNHLQLANNIPPILGEKQKYFSHNTVSYSSINQNNNYPKEIGQHESFPFNIMNIFRHIQRNKYANEESSLNKVLTEDLEESNTELMIKKFDNSILCLNWNDASYDDKDVDKAEENDETYSCVSNDSKTTFKSIRPNFSRSHSMAETFKSIESDN